MPFATRSLVSCGTCEWETTTAFNHLVHHDNGSNKTREHRLTKVNLHCCICWTRDVQCCCIACGYGVVLLSMKLQVQFLAVVATFRLGQNAKTFMGIQCVLAYSSQANYKKGQLDTKIWDQWCFVCHHLLQMGIFLLKLLFQLVQEWISQIINYLHNSNCAPQIKASCRLFPVHCIFHSYFFLFQSRGAKNE